MRKITFITFSVLLIVIRCFPQHAMVATGSIRGDVFTKDEGGGHSVLPGTRVELRGPVVEETQSDAQGAYVFDAVPPGNYSLKASATGLSATLEVEVRAGGTSVAPLELGIVAVTSAVTVTANDAASAEDSAQSTTLKQSTVETAPNLTEHFESLLPLVPGVVRGTTLTATAARKGEPTASMPKTISKTPHTVDHVEAWCAIWAGV